MLFISEKVLSLHPNLLVSSSIYDIFVLGLTGFDGKSRWYVSMRSDGCVLHNQVGRKINWRNTLRSRCLIEAQ